MAINGHAPTTSQTGTSGTYLSGKSPSPTADPELPELGRLLCVCPSMGARVMLASGKREVNKPSTHPTGLRRFVTFLWLPTGLPGFVTFGHKSHGHVGSRARVNLMY